MITIDPVSTANPGWSEFLLAYNSFCSDHGGIPLFNQTDAITPAQVRKAFGSRLATLSAARAHFDPSGRFLSPYFREMLAAPSAA
jgi:hypothetical protein